MTQKRRIWATGILGLALALSLLLTAGCRPRISSVLDQSPSSMTQAETPDKTQATDSDPGETTRTTSKKQTSPTSRREYRTTTTTTRTTTTTTIPTLPPAHILPDEEPVVSGLTPLKREEYYGRQQLAAMSRSENLLAAYDRISTGIEHGESRISLQDSQLPLTVEELQLVAEYYWRDYPQHFWYKGSYTYRYSGATAIYMEPDYSMTGTQLDQARDSWQAVVKDALSGVSAGQSEYDREKHLHDWLAAKCDYVAGMNAHNAYGALVEGAAVCDGYARAFQYLLYQAGIQSLFVTGSSSNPGSGLSEGHGWNIARIDGAYYHVDLTWNDQTGQLYYAYFNLEDWQILEDHQLDLNNYPLPTCDSQDANFFMRNNLFIAAPTVDWAYYLLDQGNGTARAYIYGDVQTFLNWFELNHAAVARKLGITGVYTYGYSYLGHEVIFYVR